MTFTHKVGPSPMREGKVVLPGVTFTQTEQLEAMTEAELEALRYSQVWYIEHCLDRIEEGGSVELDLAIWHPRIAMASRMTTRIDIALSKLRDW